MGTFSRLRSLLSLPLSTRLGWLAFLVLLFAIGWTLNHLLSATPAWTLRGDLIPVAITPDNSTLIALGQGRDHLVIVDLAGGHELQTLFVPKAGRALHHSPDRCVWIASPPFGNDLLLADLRTGKERKVLLGDEDHYTGFVFSPDQSLVAFRGTKKLCLLEVETGTVHQWTTEASVDYRFTPGLFVWWSRGHKLLRMWDTKANADLGGQSLESSVFWLSPDGRWLIVGEGDGTQSGFMLWDFPDRQQSTELGNPAKPKAIFSPDGRFLAFGNDHDKLAGMQLWDCLERRMVTPVPSNATGMLFVPDNRLFVKTTSAMAVHELPSGAVQWTHETSVFRIASPPDKFVQLHTKGHLNFVEIETGKPRLSLPVTHGGSSPASGWTSNVTWLASSADGRYQCLVNHNTVARDNRFGWLGSLLREWLPRAWFRDHRNLEFVTDEEVIVVDQRDLRVISWQNVKNCGTPILISQDGRFLVTIDRWDSVRGIRCWSLPLRKPWHWIAGPPLALGLLGLAWRRPRRRRRPPEAPPPTESVPAGTVVVSRRRW